MFLVMLLTLPYLPYLLLGFSARAWPQNIRKSMIFMRPCYATLLTLPSYLIRFLYDIIEMKGRKCPRLQKTSAEKTQHFAEDSWEPEP